MQIRLSDPGRLPQLKAFLAFDHDAHVTVTGDDELEVWFVGSRNAWAQVKETELRLRAWMRWNPDVIATLIP